MNLLVPLLEVQVVVVQDTVVVLQLLEQVELRAKVILVVMVMAAVAVAVAVLGRLVVLLLQEFAEV
jgi:hypothetical protein